MEIYSSGEIDQRLLDIRLEDIHYLSIVIKYYLFVEQRGESSISGMEYRRGLSARVSLFIDTARQTIVPINYAPRDLFEDRPRHFNEPSPAIAVTLPLTPMHFPKRIYGFVERRKGVLKGPCLVEKFNSKSFRFKVDFFLRII